MLADSLGSENRIPDDGSPYDQLTSSQQATPGTSTHRVCTLCLIGWRPEAHGLSARSFKILHAKAEVGGSGWSVPVTTRVSLVQNVNWSSKCVIGCMQSDKAET